MTIYQPDGPAVTRIKELVGADESLDAKLARVLAREIDRLRELIEAQEERIDLAHEDHLDLWHRERT
jgi:hypothetical protein